MGNNSVAIGPNSVANGDNSVAMGNGAVTTTTATNALAMGTSATASAANSVALGSNSVANGSTLSNTAYNPDGNAAGVNPVGEVSVGSAGAERRITNVAAGSAPTDAVNVSQLQGMGSVINAKIDGLDNKLSAGVASAIALQAPALIVPGKTTVRAGVGYFRGQTAMGVSVRQTADNGRWSLTGGVSASKGGVAAGAGVEWVMGKD